MKIRSRNPADTVKLGRDVASKMNGGEVLCLFGELGSGKTTFMEGFINYFLPGKRVLSPTFIIVRHYSIKSGKIKNLLHADLYRINKVNNITDLGLREFLNLPDTLVAIEWAEKLQKELPKERTDILFKIISDSGREIHIK